MHLQNNIKIKSGVTGENPIGFFEALQGNYPFAKAWVEKVIVPAEDGVKYFPLCRKCAGAVEIIGQGVFTDPDEEYYIY